MDHLALPFGPYDSDDDEDDDNLQLHPPELLSLSSNARTLTGGLTGGLTGNSNSNLNLGLNLGNPARNPNPHSLTSLTALSALTGVKRKSCLLPAHDGRGEPLKDMSNESLMHDPGSVPPVSGGLHRSNSCESQSSFMDVDVDVAGDSDDGEEREGRGRRRQQQQIDFRHDEVGMEQDREQRREREENDDLPLPNPPLPSSSSSSSTTSTSTSTSTNTNNNNSNNSISPAPSPSLPPIPDTHLSTPQPLNLNAEPHPQYTSTPPVTSNALLNHSRAVATLRRSNRMSKKRPRFGPSGSVNHHITRSPGAVQNEHSQLSDPQTEGKNTAGLSWWEVVYGSPPPSNMDICTPSKASAPLRGCLSTGCSKKASKSRPQHVGFSRCDAVEFKRDEPSTAMKRMNREDAEAMFKVEEKQVDQGERETQEITWGNTEALRQAEEGWEEDYNDETVERVVGRRASNIFKKGEFEAEEGDFGDEGDDTHSPLRWDNNSSNSDSGSNSGNSNSNDNEEQDNNYQPGMDMNMNMDVNGDADVDDINSSSSSYFNNIPQLLSSLSTATEKDTSTAISTGPLHRLLSLVPYHPVSDSVINAELERAASEISSNPPSSLHAFEHTCCLNILNNLTALRDSLASSSLSSSPSSSPVAPSDKISDVEFLKIECSSLSSEIKLNESVLLSLRNAEELMKVDRERSRWHLLRSILNYSIMILDDGIIVSLEQIRKYGGKGWRGKWTMIGEDECRLTGWGGDGDNFKCRDDEFEYSGTTVEVAEAVKPLLEFLTNSSEWMVKGGILPTGVVAPSELSKVVETGSRYMSSVVDVVDTINWCDSVGTVEVRTYVKGTVRDGKEEEELQDGEPVRSRHEGGGENVEVDLYLDSPDGREKVRVKIEISVRKVCEISRIWVEGDERTSVMLEEVVEEILGQT